MLWSKSNGFVLLSFYVYYPPSLTHVGISFPFIFFLRFRSISVTSLFLSSFSRACSRVRSSKRKRTIHSNASNSSSVRSFLDKHRISRFSNEFRALHSPREKKTKRFASTLLRYCSIVFTTNSYPRKLVFVLSGSRRKGTWFEASRRVLLHGSFRRAR